LLWWEVITGEPDWTLAWVKRNGQSVTGFGGTNKWDPVLCYGIKPDNDIDIVEISNDYSEKIKHGGSHPTAKPVKLWEYCIERFGGKVVYEPFSGSGTTIIAAENLGRQSRAVEISPAYCAVALQRYVDAFGIEPELIG
jgi:DNA modification methylase